LEYEQPDQSQQQQLRVVRQSVVSQGHSTDEQDISLSSSHTHMYNCETNSY